MWHALRRECFGWATTACSGPRRLDRFAFRLAWKVKETALEGAVREAKVAGLSRWAQSHESYGSYG